MNHIAFYLVILLNTVFGFRYAYLTIKKKIHPSLAMWIFFTIAVTGSLFSYMLEGNFTLWDHILNTTDVILCSSLSLVILFHGSVSSKFSKFDIGCLVVVFLILIFWFLTKAHFATHLSLQVIQGMAYLPVFHRMITTKKNSESFVTWILLLVISVISLFTAKGFLAYVYIIRAIVCISLLLILMLLMELRGTRSQRKSS